SETERYGEYSKPGEFVYDHPFLWGSKRTGPDLARIGGKYPSAWHWKHMMDPRSTSPNSIMPAYSWLYDDDLDISHTEGKIMTMQKLGVPYPYDYEFDATDDLKAQEKKIAGDLTSSGIANVNPNREIIALIAYLQRLGTDIKKQPGDTSSQFPGESSSLKKIEHGR
ncbi:MAG: cbb3-type cytochrome c oxidase subunit II, partial [Candidatus Kapaibacterium sp.]